MGGTGGSAKGAGAATGGASGSNSGGVNSLSAADCTNVVTTPCFSAPGGAGAGAAGSNPGSIGIGVSGGAGGAGTAWAVNGLTYGGGGGGSTRHPYSQPLASRSGGAGGAGGGAAGSLANGVSGTDGLGGGGGGGRGNGDWVPGESNAGTGGAGGRGTVVVRYLIPTPPAAPSLTGAPTSPTTETSASLGFTGDSGATFLCSIDGGTFTACTSPTTAGPLTNGPHSFAVKAVKDGLEGPAATASWTVQAPLCTPRPTPPTPTVSVTVSRRQSNRWVMNAGSVFSTGGDQRGCAQILTIQVSSDLTKPLDSLAHPTVASFANGILVWTGSDVSRNGKQPRWMRVGNRIGRWSGWVQVTQ